MTDVIRRSGEERKAAIEDSAAALGIDEQGEFHFERWGDTGLNEVTPLWLLKYLPVITSYSIHYTKLYDMFPAAASAAASTAPWAWVRAL